MGFLGGLLRFCGGAAALDFAAGFGGAEALHPAAGFGGAVELDSAAGFGSIINPLLFNIVVLEMPDIFLSWVSRSRRRAFTRACVKACVRVAFECVKACVRVVFELLENGRLMR